MKIHAGDIVAIIAGKDKGKQGRVTRVLADKNRVVVEGVNMRVRHIRKTAEQAGQRISFEASLHASNVMILDPKTKKPTRIGYKVDAKTGAKKRFAKASGEVIAKAAMTKAAAKPAKKIAGTAVEKKEDKKAEAKVEAPKVPAKTPFWKRGGKGSGAVEGGAGTGSEAAPNVIQTAHRAQGG